VADVEPPAGVRVIPYDVFLKLKVLEEKLLCANFKGMSGFTNLDILTELVEVGRRYGELHPWGVKVSTSVRALALRARVSSGTVSASLTRLEAREPPWVRRLDRGVGTNSGSLVLRVSDEDLDSYELPEESTEEECQGRTNFHIPYFRWGTGKLGKMIRLILQHAQVLQPCQRADIARAMGRESRVIKEHMKRLRDCGLVEYDDRTHLYTLPSDFESRLFQALVENGIHHTDLKHKKLFERERMAFRALRSIKATKETVGV
jgi:DNA-binding transcriptional ArsR family regulator